MIARLRACAAITLALAISAGIASAQSAPLPGTVILPPQNGVYLGAFVQGGDTAPGVTQSFESGIGRKLAMHVSFYGFDKIANIATDAKIRDDLATGRIPVLSWACGGTQLSDIASGADDARLDRAAGAFKAVAKPVMVRFMWEMNLNLNGGEANGNNCFSGGSVNQDASEYVAAQRHIEDRLAADGVRNVTWLWCPAGSPGQLRHLEAQGIEAFYPGARYVDWVCFDAYDFAGHGALGTLAPFVQAFAHLGKPMIIAETGEKAAANGRGPHPSQAAYLSELASAVKPGGQLFPIVKAICYFHSTPHHSGIPWTLSGEGLSTFTQVAQDPYFNPPLATGPRR